ncbi:hypothetical protein [Desulforamulus putei]|uniref:hypothetical protein n=1 Tax=Desulforamulus putei TaxID=74701 RepID=UPI000934DAF0|nr:hypothetical protein [Desulforamulus putei]
MRIDPGGMEYGLRAGKCRCPGGWRAGGPLNLPGRAGWHGPAGELMRRGRNVPAEADPDRNRA